MKKNTSLWNDDDDIMINFSSVGLQPYLHLKIWQNLCLHCFYCTLGI